MGRSTRISMVTALAMAALPMTAQAAPTINLAFTQPFGTALATDTINVFVTVNVAAGSQTVAAYLGDNAGRISEFMTSLNAANFDLTKAVTFSYGGFITCSSGAQINSFIGSNCSSGPYSLGFGSGSSQSALMGAAGSSTSVMFTSYIPKGGVAPAGTYTDYDVGYQLSASGTNTSSAAVSATLVFSAFSITQSGGAPFVRNVGSAVPEPASWALMIVGFGVAGMTLRRRQAVRVRATVA